MIEIEYKDGRYTVTDTFKGRRDFLSTPYHDSFMEYLARTFSSNLQYLLDTCHHLTAGPLCDTFEKICMLADTYAEQIEQHYPENKPGIRIASLFGNN